jgi:hypothetical protein
MGSSAIRRRCERGMLEHGTDQLFSYIMVKINDKLEKIGLGLLTPYEFWMINEELGNPFALLIALLSGVTLSALLAMKSIGKLVLPVKGPMRGLFKHSGQNL